jgi:hypothetical protein
MNVFCILKKHGLNGVGYHVHIAAIALKKMDSLPAQNVWARWGLFTYHWTPRVDS